MLYIGIPSHNEASTVGLLLWRLRSVMQEVAREYDDIMGRGNYFLEVQANGVPEQDKVNAGIIEISKKTGISTATVTRVARCLAYGQEGGYRRVLDRLAGGGRGR